MSINSGFDQQIKLQWNGIKLHYNKLSYMQWNTMQLLRMKVQNNTRQAGELFMSNFIKTYII